MSLLQVGRIVVEFNDRRAVDEVSISVSRGEIVGLIGPNGAGKSTVLSAITGMQSISAGEILFDSYNVTRMPAWRRASIGMARTFQSGELTHALSVRDNLLLGCQMRQRTGFMSDGFRLPSSHFAEKAALAEVARIAAQLDIANLLERDIPSLPLGQRRIVEFGRALCLDPKLLLLDELAPGMTTAELTHFASVLADTVSRNNLGVLMVEHDVQFVFAICSFIYVMADGEIIARGTPQTLAKDERVREVYAGEGIDEFAAIS